MFRGEAGRVRETVRIERFMTKPHGSMQNRHDIAKYRIAQVKAERLIHLSLSTFRLGDLPESIGELTHLQTLDISGNNLTECPGFLRNLANLRVLNLAFNHLEQLPQFICGLNLLNRLDLSYNRLSSLPSCVGNLTALRELLLSNNRLRQLPPELEFLPNLDTLELEGNASLDVAPMVGVVGQVKQIVHYASELQRSGARPLNEAKLILVGRGGVGKTSLANRLIRDTFSASQAATDGIEIREWNIKLRTGEHARLNVWDFGGQEIAHATHQFFLTRRSIYLIVLNGREGTEDVDAEYWLRLIQSFAPESPIILVLNRVNEHPFDLNRSSLQRRFPSAIRGFFHTDCEDGTGIAELRKAISRETDRLEHLRTPFPLSWFAVKDRLSQHPSYMHFDQYRMLCVEHGVTDETDQNQLAQYLHHLGVILNFADDPRLQDTNVLNPQWVTRGIYGLLYSPLLERQDGEVWLEEVSKILNPREYPSGMRRFVIDLMKKFDLCFSFPNEETHFLIPDLLPKDEPEEVERFDLERCLNFQYRYTILPQGLVPRFIVRTHTLSEGLPRWRSGVILRWGSAEAVVRADFQSARILISIRGEDAEQRVRLLALIRYTFDEIHNNLSGLRPEEWVPIPRYAEYALRYEDLQVFASSKDHPTIEMVIDGEIMTYGVRQLLQGVDLNRTENSSIRANSQPIRVFVSYSHKDEIFRNELEKHLKLLQRSGQITTWHDRVIEPGEDWARMIDENLRTADVVLLLISPDFIDSDFCYEVEMEAAMKRHQGKEAVVVPIIVRDCVWKAAPFAAIQALPRDAVPISQWDDRDSAWRNVEEGIEKVVRKLQSVRSNRKTSSQF